MDDMFFWLRPNADLLAGFVAPSKEGWSLDMFVYVYGHRYDCGRTIKIKNETTQKTQRIWQG